MNAAPQQLYLDLLKKTLSFTLWPEPPEPIDLNVASMPPHKRFVVASVSTALRRLRLALVRERHHTDAERRDGKLWPQYADTMIGLKRLNNLQFAIETVISEQVPGDFIETGVWRGGSCIFMRAVLASYSIKDRRVFVADSFDGLPRPDARYPQDAGDRHYANRLLAVSRADVENNFRRYGLLDDQVVFVAGWFKDSLPNAPIGKLAVMRLDGDMYGSTMDALTHLYPRLSSGGFCIIDDYSLPGCEKAVEDFRKQHQITSEMHEIDWTGRYWRKP